MKIRSGVGSVVLRLHELEAENEKLKHEVLKLQRRDKVRGDLEAANKALRAELYARSGRGYVPKRTPVNRAPRPTIAGFAARSRPSD
jgi:cell shape-determining protein MreC